jgi:hypothetical protein
MDELKDLKSQAYDCLAAIEHYQKMLNEINNKIAEIQKKQADDKQVPHP